MLQDTEDAHFIFRGTLLGVLGQPMPQDPILGQQDQYGAQEAQSEANGQTIPAVYYQVDSLKASAEGGDPLAANILGAPHLQLDVIPKTSSPLSLARLG